MDVGRGNGTGGPGACGSAGAAKHWTEALAYAACLNANSYLGYTDWRLPNRKELRSLLNYGQPGIAAWLNSEGFTSLASVNYWTSTTYAADHAWYVRLSDGYTGKDIDKTGTMYVLPVRGGQ